MLQKLATTQEKRFVEDEITADLDLQLRILVTEHVPFEPVLFVNHSAQGIEGEGSMQFRLNIHWSKNFISFEG